MRLTVKSMSAFSFVRDGHHAARAIRGVTPRRDLRDEPARRQRCSLQGLGAEGHRRLESAAEIHATAGARDEGETGARARSAEHLGPRERAVFVPGREGEKRARRRGLAERTGAEVDAANESARSVSERQNPEPRPSRSSRRMAMFLVPSDDARPHHIQRVMLGRSHSEIMIESITLPPSGRRASVSGRAFEGLTPYDP
jgi:hypothetical protein